MISKFLWLQGAQSHPHRFGLVVCREPVEGGGYFFRGYIDSAGDDRSRLGWTDRVVERSPAVKHQVIKGAAWQPHT